MFGQVFKNGSIFCHCSSDKVTFISLSDYKTKLKCQQNLVIKDSENLILQLKASIEAAENLLVEQRRDLEKIESEYEKSKS